MDIIAEKISDDADVRKRMRFVASAHGMLTVKAVTEDAGVYEMYKDYSEPVSKIPDHRILAINRGEKEEILKVSLDFDRDKAMFIIAKNHIKEGSAATAAVKAAAEDAYTRLIFPSVGARDTLGAYRKGKHLAIKGFFNKPASAAYAAAR